ncbi:CmpA/NrtA family ABC transporter substrate-binding protein [Ferrovibrio sp.]|uniref:CmpA/NrtA family ABC transporter substrate-binding protein n=1 Tax=Ferrovibrio sp. TaxID=1917215 RepID=UPI0025BB8857|nr:CmpA/NrtA family ABC transporter substrate-binding protein [Ferrovibrio sp.]MBX3454899.1 ABC transporter substrate-binding protein [Ferrovibrio sp.]
MRKDVNKQSRKLAVNRRDLLKTGAGVAGLLAAAKLAFPSGAFAQAAGPEVKGARLGYIALTDASPLIIAKEKGLFAKYGLPDMSIEKQASWGATRDNLELGEAGGGITGAHILTPMPYLISSGKVTKNNVKLPMYILARLNTNGQAISVSKNYAGMGVTTDAKTLAAAFKKGKAEGKDLKAAMTFPGGTHDMWIRYWLSASGIDPDKDIATIVVPPPQMVANMKVNAMEAFCVCEPWNLQLIHQKIGFTALMTGELWKDHPEKSLGLRADWVDKNPKAAKAILMATQEAQMWCDKMENKEEMCNIVGGRDWFKVPVKDILDRTQGTIDYGDGNRTAKVGVESPLMMKFWRDHASYPFQSHELWFLIENIRWGYQPADLDTAALVKQVNREDLWREAAKGLGVSDADLPKSTSRGKETFFDGKVFDPADPSAYLKSLAIARV